MVDIKIIITAAPRSGHAWFTYLLKNVLLSNTNISDNSSIERNNTPLMLYGKFDNTIQATILRKPEEIIPSNLTKLFAGFGNNYSGNITLKHEFDNEFLNLINMTYEQIYQYKNWTNSINQNLDKIIPFTFEQITNNPDYVCKYFIDYYKLSDIDIKNLNFNEILNQARHNVKQHIKIEKNYSNAFPVDIKPEFYYEAKNFLLQHEKYQEIQDIYNLTLNNIVKFHFS